MKKDRYFLHLLFSLPLLVAGFGVFVWLAQFLSIEIKPGIMALGALGWWLALVLRLPIIVLVKHKPQAKAQSVITLFSGPAEELMRLGVLLFLGLTIENAYSIGLGWAAIEIIYSVVQGVAMGVLRVKNDPRALEAKAMLETMGMDKALKPSAPYWGALERMSATALHLTFSLVLVISPLMVLLTAPVHSSVNLLLVSLVKKSMSRAELVLFVISSLLLSAVVWLVAI